MKKILEWMRTDATNTISSRKKQQDKQQFEMTKRSHREPRRTSFTAKSKFVDYNNVFIVYGKYYNQWCMNEWMSIS